MIHRFAGIGLAAFLASCTAAVPPPLQPDPTSVQVAENALGGLPGTPMEIWEAGDYAVRSACHSYLNAAAARSNELTSASALVGGAGAGASIANPMAGVASSLAQTFLTAFQSAGAIPYSVSTTTIIENALDAYETGIDQSPPLTPAQAMLDVESLWWHCSPGGYAQLAQKGISTAVITTAQPFALAASGAPRLGRVHILVNGR
jgi:hypothetical protein